MMYGTPTWRPSRMWLTGLRHRAVSRSNNQDRAVHLSRTSDHVFNIVGVARAVYVARSGGSGVSYST
ncbi:Uncharacterised protein [Salmonella enterica subsp. arizonae]|uniref:Uncharacterized protein n=1 Tax=Salmonella enterica subsp. arizonae TaxID=59203 RepID=A0A379RWS7_SALER|nr:Uncharacterised protein [Salmonella enterica subsp. arizonae]